MAAPVLTSLVAVDLLEEGLGLLADVVWQPMHDRVARLDTTRARPVVYLDTDSPAEDTCWAMTDMLQTLACGTRSAWARRTPRLRSVG